MKKILKSKVFGLLILTIMAIVTCVMGSISYSRYEMNFHDEIRGEYASFYLTHDGEGKSAILATINQTGYSYEGSMSVSVFNKDEEGNVSPRLIKFTMRTPTAEEMAKGAIYDPFGNLICTITDDTSKYTVELTDALGNKLSEHISLGIMDDNKVNTEVFDTKKVNLNIKRKTVKDSEGNEETLDGIEPITVVIETSLPYKSTLAFTIFVSNRKIMFSANDVDNHYFDYSQVTTNIITSNSYELVKDDADMTSDNPVKIVLTYSGLIFDYERFRLSVYNNLKYVDPSSLVEFTNQYTYSITNGTITLFLESGSDVDLNFYIIDASSGYSISAMVYFDMDESGSYVESIDYDYTKESAGLTEIDEIHYVIKK